MVLVRQVQTRRPEASAVLHLDTLKKILKKESLTPLARRVRDWSQVYQEKQQERLFLDIENYMLFYPRAGEANPEGKAPRG